jgi:hypothetical protein
VPRGVLLCDSMCDRQNALRSTWPATAGVEKKEAGQQSTRKQAACCNSNAEVWYSRCSQQQAAHSSSASTVCITKGPLLPPLIGGTTSSRHLTAGCSSARSCGLEFRNGTGPRQRQPGPSTPVIQQRRCQATAARAPHPPASSSSCPRSLRTVRYCRWEVMSTF